jgi:hypothetical protein
VLTLIESALSREITHQTDQSDQTHPTYQTHLTNETQPGTFFARLTS